MAPHTRCSPTAACRAEPTSHASAIEIEVALTSGVDRLIVNGVPVAEVPAPAISGTAYVLLAAQNLGTSIGSASFSDFSLRPGR